MSAARQSEWNVVVWNDPVNLMIYVVWVFRSLLGLTQEGAQGLMVRVHQEGSAVVATAPREQAEVMAFWLHHHGLRATLEPG
jgi:ATP-dependent Clp protease adaptor protein ClpS